MAGLPNAFDAGLMTFSDAGSSRSAQALSQRALEWLAEKAKAHIERAIPVRVTKMLPSNGLQPNGSPEQFIKVAQEHNLRYLVIAIFSSAESDVPATLSLGGPDSVNTQGHRVQNYALAELVLLDSQTASLLFSANGRSYAILEALAVPVRSNQYPVVRRSIHKAPIFVVEEEALDTLRAVAASDALEQAALDLRRRLGVPLAF